MSLQDDIDNDLESNSPGTQVLGCLLMILTSPFRFIASLFKGPTQ